MKHLGEFSLYTTTDYVQRCALALSDTRYATLHQSHPSPQVPVPGAVRDVAQPIGLLHQLVRLDQGWRWRRLLSGSADSQVTFYSIFGFEHFFSLFGIYIVAIVLYYN